MEEEHDIYPPKIKKYGQIYKPSTGITEYTNENYYIYQNGRQESRTLYTNSNWDLTNEENYSQRGVYEGNPYTSNYDGRERENFENYGNSKVNGYSTDVHDTLPESTEIYDHGYNSHISRESAPPWIQMLSPDPSKPQNGNRSSFRLPTRIDLKEPVFPVPKDSDSDVSSEQATPRRITKTRLILFITICVILIAGVSAVSIILTRLSETDKYSYYESTIKLAVDQNYTKDLGDKESDAFKNFSKEFCLSVQDAFVSDNSSYKDSYQGCIVDQLSEGSIVVQFRIIFSIVTTTSIKNDTVSAILVQGLANGSSFAVIATSVQVSVSNIQGSSDPSLQVNMFVYVQVLSQQTTTEITSTQLTTTTNMTETTANYSDTTEAITTTLAEETKQTTEPITTTSAETTQTTEAITTSATETSQTTEEMTTSVAETTQTTEEITTSAAETTQTTEDMTTSVAETRQKTEEMTSSAAETTQTMEEITTSAAETTQTTEEMTTSAVEITQTTEPITTTSATGTTQTTESMTTKSAAETTETAEAMTTAAAETTQTTEPTTTTSVADTTQTTKSMTTTSAVEITQTTETITTTSSAETPQTTEPITTKSAAETTTVSSSTAQNTEWLTTETTVTALSTEASTETSQVTTTETTMSTISHSTKDMSRTTEVPTLSSTTIETTSSTMGNLTTKAEILTSSEEMTTTPEVLTTSTPGDTTTTPEVLTSSTPGDTTTTPVVLTTSTPVEMSSTPEVVTSSTLGDTTTTPEVLTSSTPGDTTTTSDVMTTSTPVEMTTTPEVVTSSTPGDTATTPDVLTTFTPEEMTTTPELMTTSTPEEMTTTPEVLASSTPGDTTTTTEVPTSIPLNLTTTAEVLSSTSEITTLTITATSSEAIVKRSTSFSSSTTVQGIPTTTDVQTSLHSEETTTVSSSIEPNTEELTTATSMSNITTGVSTGTTTETIPVTLTPDTRKGSTSVTTDGQTNDTAEIMSTTTEESLSGSTDTFTPTQNDTTTQTISSTTATSNDTATATMSTLTNESMISTTEVLSTTTALEETTSLATSDPMVTAVSMNTYLERAPVGGIGSFVCTASNTNISGSVVKIKRQLNDTTIATINSSGIFIAPGQENKFSAEVSQNGGDIETRFNITSITCGDEGIFVCCLEKDNATLQSPAFELSVYADPSNVELTVNADLVDNLARAGERYNHICKGNLGYPSNTSYLGIRLKKSSGDGEFVYSEATTKESDKNTNNSNFQWTVKISENETLYVVSDVITDTCALTQEIKFLLWIESSWNNGIIECFIQEWNDQQNVSVSKEINLIPGNYCTGEGNKKKYHPDGCNKWVTCYKDYPYGSSCSDTTLCYDIHNGIDYCENCDQVFCEPEPTTTPMPTTTQYSAAYVTCTDTEASINDSSAVIRCNVTSEAFTTINITHLSHGSSQEIWVASVSFNGDVVMNAGIDDVVTFNMVNNPKKLNVEVRNIDCTDRGQYIFRTLGAANYSSQSVEFRVKASPGAVTQTVNADLVEGTARAGDRYNHICKGDIGYPTGRAYVGIRLTKSGGGEQFTYSEEATSPSDIDKRNPTLWKVSILGTGTLYIAGDTTSGTCTLTQEIKYLLQLDSSWDDGTMECFVHDRQSNTDTVVSADIALIPANYCAGETNNAIKTHPGGCNKWVVCSGGNPFGSACTDLNLCYNRDKGYCESCDQVTCGS